MQETETIYNAHVEKIYKFFYSKCLNTAQAEDLTSQTFMAYLENPSREAIENHTKYLYGIMRNTWINFLRDRYKQNTVTYEHIAEFEDFVEDSNNMFDATKVKDTAQQYINRLPDKQREIAHKRLIEEMTLEEVAEHLSKTKRHVRTTQNRAIRNLKKMLSEPLRVQEVSNA